MRATGLIGRLSYPALLGLRSSKSKVRNFRPARSEPCTLKDISTTTDALGGRARLTWEVLATSPTTTSGHRIEGTTARIAPGGARTLAVRARQSPLPADETAPDPPNLSPVWGRTTPVASAA